MPRASRRNEALDAAIALILRDGATPTMELIAETAGMSRQALYLHFDTAHQLLQAMVERVGEVHGLDAWLDRIRAADDPDERLGAYLDFLAAYWDEVGTIAVALERATHASEAAREAWDEREAGQRMLAHSCIRRFVAAGRLAPGWSADTATDVLWALASPAHHAMLRDECGWSRTDYRDYLEASVRRLLLADG